MLQVALGTNNGMQKRGEERAQAGLSEWRKVSGAIRVPARTKRERGRKTVGNSPVWFRGSNAEEMTDGRAGGSRD